MISNIAVEAQVLFVFCSTICKVGQDDSSSHPPSSQWDGKGRVEALLFPFKGVAQKAYTSRLLMCHCLECHMAIASRKAGKCTLFRGWRCT